MQSIGLLILRLGLGGYMLTHGIGKVQMILDGNLDKFSDPLGIGPAASLIMLAGAEFMCSVLVILGAGTRFAAVPIAFAMGVAAFTAHGSDPWTMMAGIENFYSGASESFSSKEPALVYLISFLGLAFTGSGKYSVDAVVSERMKNRRKS